MSTMKERMHTGELYLPGDDEIMEAQARSYCRASPSATIRWSAPEASSRRTCRPMYWRLGIHAGSYVRSANTTGNTITRTGRSIITL